MKEKVTPNLRYERHLSPTFQQVLNTIGKDVLPDYDYGLQKDHVLCTVTDNAPNMVSMVNQLNERPREGSSTTEQSAAEIQEHSGASPTNQLVVCDDLDYI